MKKIVLVVFLLTVLSGCVLPDESTVPPENTTFPESMPTIPTSPSETIPSPADPHIEHIFSTTRAGLWERLEQNDSQNMGDNEFLRHVLCDEYLDDTVIKIFTATHYSYLDLDGDYTGKEKIEIIAHLGCECENLEDFLSDRQTPHSVLEIEFFYNEQDITSLFLVGSKYEQLDGKPNVYFLSAGDKAPAQYLVFISAHHACRFSIDTTYVAYEHIAQGLIEYMLSM